MKQEIKRIIVARTDKIGDLVLSIPSFFMLKKMYPKAELVVLVRNYNYDIVKNLDYIDRVIKIDDFRKEELVRKIAYFKADVFVSLYHDDYIARLVKASGAKICIGPISKLSSWFLYRKGALQKRSLSLKNEAEYNLDLVKKLSPMKYKACYELHSELVLQEENRHVANLFWEQEGLKGKVLVCNPFLGGSAKNLKDEEYARILRDFLRRSKKAELIICCHISEEERALALKEAIGSPRAHIFANGGSILNLGAVIEKADLYFGGSTGPTHMAGALGQKIVAVYPNKKTQSPTRWGIFRLNTEDVHYFVPDADGAKENYKEAYFNSMTREKEKKITKLLLEALR